MAMPADSADAISLNDLSFKIRGLLFKLQNDLGTKFQEKHYQRALCTLLDGEKIFYQTEVPFTLKYKNNPLGSFRADMIIAKTVLFELKTVDYLTGDHIQQTLRYLESLSLPLAYVVNFRKRPLEIKRLINSKALSAPSAAPGASA